LLPFAALHWWRGPPARSVGIHADVLLHCAARRPEVAPAGEDARASASSYTLTAGMSYQAADDYGPPCRLRTLSGATIFIVD